ncbi:hypothetical protein JB92DRAFT_2898995 [Gautieria morchelliformis]|nr:hypothetical protein JB92DRAFT_2898995 [Gautieria morchelliformis]
MGIGFRSVLSRTHNVETSRYRNESGGMSRTSTSSDALTQHPCDQTCNQYSMAVLTRRGSGSLPVLNL